MKNLRNAIAAIKAMAGGTIPQGGGRKRGGYAWSKPHSSMRSRLRRLKQNFKGQLSPDTFLNDAQADIARANYLAILHSRRVARRPRRTMMP